MNKLFLTTIGPFIGRTYTLFLGQRKKYVAWCIALFMLLQLVVTLAIPTIKIATMLPGVWKTIKDGVISQVQSMNFTYIGVKNQILVTDLTPQPYIYVYSSPSQKAIFAIDSTGKLTQDVLTSSITSRVVGIAIMKDQVAMKQSNGSLRTYPYTDLFSENQSFTVTKPQIVSFLESNQLETLITRALLTPSVIALELAGIAVLSFAIIIFRLIQLAIFVLIIGGISYLVAPAGSYKLFKNIAKLSLLGYMAWFYTATVIQNIPHIQSFTSFCLSYIAVPLFIVALIMQVIGKANATEKLTAQ